MIDPAILWERVDAVARRERGRALESVGTRCEIFVEDGIPYQIRVLEGVHPKGVAKKEQLRTGRNPFLPPEPDLLIGPVSTTHTAVLNKFNVFGGHLLIVTKEFQDQEGLLTAADFDALLAAMEGVDGFGFYNAGAVAGASQPHRHLQVTRLPMPPATDGWPVPIDAALDAGGPLPFRHGFVALDGRALARGDAEHITSLYLDLTDRLGLGGGEKPYNFLLTRRWMIVVPRSRDRFEGVPINSLGFAGSLLVRDDDRLARLKAVGPGAILRAVAAEGA